MHLVLRVSLEEVASLRFYRDSILITVGTTKSFCHHVKHKNGSLFLSRRCSLMKVNFLSSLPNFLEIVEDFQHPEINYPGTHRPMQLDVFIPSLSLAFEY